jgi:MFS family permease
MFSFPRAVWLLGFVSLATDAATEAIYPILPFFLTTVLGASAVSLGIVERAAEAVNSALKILSGRMADRARSKRPLVVIGYSISSFVRPMMALAQSWSHVFLIRVCDRVGKGIRGAPRDAMLAGFATQENRGQIYSFHRGMDHSGAIVGPILATVVLYFYPGEYRTLFALTIVPSAIAVLLIFFVSEDTVDRPDRAGGAGPEPARAEAARANTISEPLPRSFKHFMLVLMLFMLGSSTDAFLLLKLTDATGGTRWVPLMWAGLHVVKASASILFGSWSDRAGRRTVIAAGWVVFAVVYAGFATITAVPGLLACFFLYGFHFGFAEGAEKALVADLAPPSRRGAAFGWYTAVQGLGALVAGLLFGFLWTRFGPTIAFATGATLAIVATVLLFAVIPSKPQSSI